MRGQSFRSFALCSLCCLLFKKRAQKIRATACRLFVRFIFVPVNLLHFEAAKKLSIGALL